MLSIQSMCFVAKTDLLVSEALLSRPNALFFRNNNYVSDNDDSTVAQIAFCVTLNRQKFHNYCLCRTCSPKMRIICSGSFTNQNTGYVTFQCINLPDPLMWSSLQGSEEKSQIRLLTLCNFVRRLE